MKSLNQQKAVKTSSFQRDDFANSAPLLVILDVLVVGLSGQLCRWVLTEFTHRTEILYSSHYALYVTVCALAFPLVAHLLGGYRYEAITSLKRALNRAILAWCLVFIGGICVLAAYKISATFSRLWLASWWGVVVLLLVTMQLCWWKLMEVQRGRGVGIRRIAIIGNGGHAQRLARDLIADDAHAYQPIAYFGDLPDPAGIPRGGDVGAAVEKLKFMAAELDEVWVLQSAKTPEISQQLHESAELELFEVRIVPDTHGFSIQRQSIGQLGPHLLISLSATPQLGLEGFSKQCVDRLGSVLLILLFSPLLILIALAIRLDSRGSVLFRQKRHGLNGKIFVILKFRTMRATAAHRDGQPLQQVSIEDDRVTRVGKFLRQWSLDELPQLFNVLRGEMSMVGPRPHELGMNRSAVDKDFRYRLRHQVKPGMSGWAQIHGFRGPIETQKCVEKRLQYDLWYIENWSIWLDARILLMTVVVGFRHQNAY